MARKSRKNIDAAPALAPAAAKTWNVGAYVRLSAVDRKQKGDSIENQQAIISAYIAERSDMVLREVYIDNGTTGQTFERAGFQRMLADFESGRVDCCISKDLSRLGRNAIDTGYYIEKYFPTHGIRYIAITDNYDSADGSSGGIMVSLKNMMNETYALEVGRKIRQTKQMNIRNGGFVGSIVPYGYFKSVEDRHKLVVAPEAGAVVRRIFEMSADGRTIPQIMEWLAAEKIMPPRRYLFSKGVISEKLIGKHTLWNRGVIYEILSNRIYTGDMVQRKTSTREHVQHRLDESEWLITPDTHEGIVSRELFDKVQNMRSKQKPKAKSTNDNIFHRKLFCGHCGYTIVRRRNTDNSTTFMCNSRQSYGKNACVPVSISENALKTEILELLRKEAAVFADRRARQTAKSTNDKTQAELTQTRLELDRISGFLKGLYESLVSGDLTNGEYTELKQNYERKIAALTEREQRLRDELRERYLRESALKKAGDSLDSVSVIGDLTAATIDALIERILVFKDKHIEVTFKFSDETGETEGGDNE
jgi:DNA invertase Pin-like site-specific DNA recombinase